MDFLNFSQKYFEADKNCSFIQMIQENIELVANYQKHNLLLIIKVNSQWRRDSSNGISDQATLQPLPVRGLIMIIKEIYKGHKYTVDPI